MFLVIRLRKKILIPILFIILLLLIISVIYISRKIHSVESIAVTEDIIAQIENIFRIRNKAALENNAEALKYHYDLSTKYGTWAYEQEVKRIKYLHNWSEKQGIKFTDIQSVIKIKYVNQKGDILTANFIRSTEYHYSYDDQPDVDNLFRIGTYHLLSIKNTDESWTITKEWYTDPFEDSLNLDNIKTDEYKNYIMEQEPRNFSDLNKRRIDAVHYADLYCGAAGTAENDFSYNKKYRDYNPLGGDCANFASQILFEGGKFKKNKIWNYGNVATRAWVNASGFKNYWINSGRASVIAYGTYDKVYRASYKLLTGDFIAYEKKGDVTHISVVTGADSKGYSLVNCHNTDRYRVPWDLGWSNKEIKFWLVRVHY